jgi:hypothetical protein
LPSGAISLNVGSNIISVAVTAQDGITTDTYTITVTRAVPPSTDATLSNIIINSGTLSPTFASGTTSYTDSVANIVSSVTVTPTVHETHATITVNGTPATSGSPSSVISLNVGSSIISVVVTAQDGATTDTYTITVTRATPLAITTSALPRWSVERGASPPPMPGWVKGVAYSASLTAAGGTSPYSWSATSLPPGLNISTDGNVTGVPITAGVYNIVFTVTASSTPPDTTSQTLPLKIYLQGDANGDGIVNGADIPGLEAILLGHSPPTAGADANLDGSINGGDMGKVQSILLHP